MSEAYDPAHCDLCGSSRHSEIMKMDQGRVMLSDRRIVPGILIKWQCDRCGMVRSGPGLGAESLPPRTQRNLGQYTGMVTSLEGFYQPEEMRLHRCSQE